MKRALCALALLSACDPGKDTPGGGGDGGALDGGADSGDSGGDSGSDGGAAWDCDALAPLPVESERLDGFTTGEDFAFTADGFVVSVDENGHLVKQDIDGNTTVIRPNIGTAAGTRMLPDGDVVLANVGTGSLDRITMAGGLSTIASGFSYPNGIDVGLDGMVYVADQNRGTLTRVDPETGASETVARGMYNPNGVSFDQSGERVYVGSFGAGAVYAVDRDGAAAWTRARVYAITPEASGPPIDTCPEQELGDTCMLATGGGGVGACAEDAQGAWCEAAVDEAACEGLAVGDPCQTSLLGEPVDNLCAVSAAFSTPFCPRTALDRLTPCEGVAEYGPCSLDGARGFCDESWEGLGVCISNDEYYDLLLDPCEILAEGDACLFDYPAGPMEGSCTDASSWGLPGLACLPPGWAYDHGGLDGIGVDACDNLYVAEYIVGSVWRFSEEGGEAEEVARIRSSWIPNLHWGLGVGGFEADVLYVADRDHAALHALEVGVGGHTEAYP
jgi:sugar lactone lactonase YvrE